MKENIFFITFVFTDEEGFVFFFTFFCERHNFFSQIRLYRMISLSFSLKGERWIIIYCEVEFKCIGLICPTKTMEFPRIY